MAQTKKPEELNPVIAELNKAFDGFNKELFSKELPRPVITIMTRGRRKAYGWFAENRWQLTDSTDIKHEINIAAEVLDRKDEGHHIGVTLLHEMVHLYNKVNNVLDVSPNGYHKKKDFGIAAEEHGLECEYPKSYPGVVTPGFNLDGKKAWSIINFNWNVVKTFRISTEGRPNEKKIKPWFCPDCKTTVHAGARIDLTEKVLCITCNTYYIPKNPQDRPKEKPVEKSNDKEWVYTLIVFEGEEEIEHSFVFGNPPVNDKPPEEVAVSLSESFANEWEDIYIDEYWELRATENDEETSIGFVSGEPRNPEDFLLDDLG